MALGAPLLLLAGAATTLPDTGLVLGLTELVDLRRLAVASPAPRARWHRLARRRGDAWLYAVARHANDPPRSAGPFLAALGAHLDSAGWSCSLVTNGPTLVARYREIGFERERRARELSMLRRCTRGELTRGPGGAEIRAGMSSTAPAAALPEVCYRDA